MKIVYVGDNRFRKNYGCRATSTALSQIISKNNEIVGTIYGDYTNVDTGNLFFSKYYPKFIYKLLGKSKHNEILRQFFYSIHRIISHGNYFLGTYDFISYDFEKSIKNLIKCLPANPHLKSFDLTQYDFDALVVNGEGSFIFANPPWRECMIEAMLMYWAQKMGKKVYYLNGMLSKDPYTELNYKTIELVKPIFEKTEIVSVREQYSYEFAKKHFSNANIKYYPDALFSWYKYVNDGFKIENGKYFIGMSGAFNDSFESFDFSKKYICISGSSSVMLAAKNKEEAVIRYSKLVEQVRKKFKFHEIYLVEVCEGDDFLRDVSIKTNTPVVPADTPILSAAKILANASLFISGRYHPAILASLGGTPCVFMSSNSHKTLSLQEILDYSKIREFNVMPTDEEIEEMLEFGEDCLKQGNKLRKKIKNKAKELSDLTVKQDEEIN